MSEFEFRWKKPQEKAKAPPPSGGTQLPGQARPEGGRDPRLPSGPPSVSNDATPDYRLPRPSDRPATSRLPGGPSSPRPLPGGSKPMPSRPDPETERAQALIRAAFNEQFAQAQGTSAPTGPTGTSATEGSAPRSPGNRDPEIEELLVYLDEVINDYQRHVENIGELGFAAPMTLYYRDEIQETLAMLDREPGVDTQPYYRRTVEYDTRLKARRQDLVDEIGHINFKQYQIINDPPRSHWWWYLNTETKAPPPPAPFWQFWNKRQNP